MTCESEQRSFEEKLAEVQNALKTELDAIAQETERKAKEIEADFEADNDLAAGVGAVAGTVVGGIIGNAPGAAVGAVVGKQIGQLFTLEIGMRRERIVLDVPQVRMNTRSFSFDLPQVSMRDKEIIFHVPTIEMRRTEGPPIPETTIRWEQKCVGGGWARICTDVPVTVVEWKKTYLDVPVTIMKEQRIVIGIPEVRMDRQEIKLDIPEFAVRPTEIIFDVPSITLRFLKDAGRRTAALAAALAQSAEEAAAQKQLAFKERLRSEVAPLALRMFACFRGTVSAARAEASARYEPELAKLTAAVTAIIAKGAPADDVELIAAKRLVDATTAQRDAALKVFDDALADLDKSSKETLDQFLADNEKGAASDASDDAAFARAAAPARLPVGSLIRFAPPAA